VIGPEIERSRMSETGAVQEVPPAGNRTWTYRLAGSTFSGDVDSARDTITVKFPRPQAREHPHERPREGKSTYLPLRRADS
jgi:hypothetical protein